SKTRQEREARLKKMLEDWERSLDDKKIDVETSAKVAVFFNGTGNFRYAKREERERLRKEYLETLQRGLDEVEKHFKGTIPTLTGIKIEQKGLVSTVDTV